MSYCTPQEVAQFMQLQEVGDETQSWPSDGLLGNHINMVAAEIDAALQSSDQLGCTKAAYSAQLLKMINVIGAVLITEFDNVNQLTEGDKIRHQEWKTDQLNLIRTGQTVVCAGETNMDYPAVAVAEVGWTIENSVKIIRAYEMRTRA